MATPTGGAEARGQHQDIIQEVKSVLGKTALGIIAALEASRTAEDPVSYKISAQPGGPQGAVSISYKPAAGAKHWLSYMRVVTRDTVAPEEAAAAGGKKPETPPRYVIARYAFPDGGRSDPWSLGVSTAGQVAPSYPGHVTEANFIDPEKLTEEYKGPIEGGPFWGCAKSIGIVGTIAQSAGVPLNGLLSMYDIVCNAAADAGTQPPETAAAWYKAVTSARTL